MPHVCLPATFWETRDFCMPWNEGYLIGKSKEELQHMAERGLVDLFCVRHQSLAKVHREKVRRAGLKEWLRRYPVVYFKFFEDGFVSEMQEYNKSWYE